MKIRTLGAVAVLGMIIGLLSACSTGASVPVATPVIDVTSDRVVQPGEAGSSLLGSPTDSSVLINTLAETGMKVIVNYGVDAKNLTLQTAPQTSTSGEPIVTLLTGLNADTTYFYSVAIAMDTTFAAAPTKSFHTARANGESFSFGVQGDSHPERDGKMFDAALYQTNLQNAASSGLDFYYLMGDDFSIDKVIQDGTVSQSTVDERYLLQRTYLDEMGSSTPVFAVNGNHEQAAQYLLDGTPDNAAVYAGTARNTYFPLPSPGGFYTGDVSEVTGVGLLHDYYAYTWGDALFVVIDPYWHSSVAVDNAAEDGGSSTSSLSDTGPSPESAKKSSTPKTTDKGKGKNKTGESTDPSNQAMRDLWNNTLGKDQYDWFVKTLSESDAPYKFVFTHHVLGTGRGGIELAPQYEWGGYDKKGTYLFDQKRPEWGSPIQHVMADNGVTIFFQGHDHLFAQQELDGVVYQTVPVPADPTFTAFNSAAYSSGTILPNSGFLKVTVAPAGVTVDYIASGGEHNGESIYRYTVKARGK